ncbi:MAG TPA: hypothetical protein ENN21_03600, partial [Spirochaetes bacterium]|nr:hypothetical protein [Spirochaetota bacterium]
MALRQKIEIEAHEYRGGRIVPVTLPVSAEYRLTLHLDGAPWCVFACSGSDIEQLALGNLRANGAINSIEDVLAVEIDEAAMAVHVRTVRPGARHRAGIGVETTASGLGQPLQSISAEHITANSALPAVKAPVVIAAMAEFLEFSVLHRQTHGVHGAALYTPDGERLCFFDEIGRHNAIDKT